MSRRFVALDRDGTLIVYHHYLSDPDLVALLPGTAPGLRRLRALGLGLVVVTNQSPIGRGLFGHAQLGRIHARMEALLAAEGIHLDGLYYCPHTPEDGCACRKPRTGLLDQAARDHGFNPRAAFVVGDNTSDIGMGQNAGAVTVLVRTGCGAGVEASGAAAPDEVVDDVAAAAEAIARRLGT